MSEFAKDTNAPDDTISRQAAQTELMMKCERYTLAREESNGIVGHVEWSSDLISVADAMDAIRDLPSAQPELTDDMAIEHLQSTGWMQNHDKEMYEMGLRERLADDSDSYDSLIPSVEPERKTGKWIIKETLYEDEEAKCSCCGFETLVNQPGNGLHMVDDLHFCPYCGAYMRGEGDG